MPLRNRVTPFGELIATPARGALMGNRGCLHDAARRIVRQHRSGYRAWVTCVLAFKGRRRVVMTPDRYTELFFLDEATALAAGHRPCGECRRDDFRRFKEAWLRGNPEHGLPPPTRIGAIDRALHGDRLRPGGHQQTFRAPLATLPAGVFVTVDGDPSRALLVRGGRLWLWSPAGYERLDVAVPDVDVTVLTPRSTVRAIAAGYAPQVHPSASGPAVSDRA